MASHNKLPDHKVRCKEVDDEIESLFKAEVPIFKIARAIPIGEIFVRRVLTEKKLLPRAVQRKRFAERKEKDRAYYVEVRKKAKQQAKSKELEAQA